MEQQNKEKRKLKMNRMQWTIAAGVLILAVVLVYALVKNNKVASSYEVVTSMSRGDDTSVYYCMMRKGMVKYSKDGVAMTNKSGTVLWNQTYEMASPTMTSAGDYVAVGDIGANTIYIFNEYGQLGRVSTDVPIQEIQISEQGVVAAVLSDTSSNYINLYDKQGNSLGSIKASLENTGYPLAIALSPDASKLAVSYLIVKSGSMQSRIVSYDFSDVEGDHLRDTQELEGLYPKAAFLDSRKVVLFGEKGFVLYQADSKKIETQENFESEINSVFCTNQKLGFIFKNEDDNGKYRMEIYNKAGKKSSTYYFDLDYSGMTADDDEVILYNDEEMLIYQMGGRVRFRGTFNTAVTGVMPSWEDGLYWLIDDQSLREIRIR
ncbi:hypothetical protein CC1_28720 [Coprococcus catus GD/7]|jgi:hypothetical protein|uniref:Uncharacterized protein n=1 Tax=Coprococcus catus GD/7 TaxID=717962 RepID=D4JAV3_9FIRM|nr:DUF5711 family protein [Coprococcus catus]CBK81474.1 hypothetical protein CC1_28720 [Coprococcus catus GD/7]